MKLARKVGSTSEIWQVFVRDSSSTSGAGLTGLTNASAGLTAYYHRDTDTAATAIGLVTMTVGTFTSSGFKEIDATNMPGWYQFCPPNAALASGAKSCVIHLKGATNMAPLPIEVDLDAQVDVTHWSGTAVATPDTAGYPKVTVKSGTGSGEISLSGGLVTLSSTQAFNMTGSITGNLLGSVNSIASGGIVAASFAAGAIDSNAIATDAIGSAELAAGAVTKIQAGLSTLDAAAVRTAVGLASANLDAQLGTIAGYIDTEVGAIKTVTDHLATALETPGGGVYRYTTAALVNAPAGGGGGGALTGAQDTKLTQIHTMIQSQRQ